MSQVTYVGAGTFQSALGAITITSPAGTVAGDTLLVVFHSSNQPIATPSGWNSTSVNVAGNTVTLTAGAVGTAGAAGAIGLQVFWRTATGTDSLTTVDSGDHNFGQMFGFKNCSTAGGPIDAYAVTNVTSASTTYTCPTVTTLSPDNLVVLVLANAVDGNAASSPTTVTNANLTSITARANNNTNTGTGGGFSVVTGIESDRNFAIGTSSGTGTSSVQSNATIVLRPEEARSTLIT